MPKRNDTGRDAALLERYLSGDRCSLAEIVERFRPLVYAAVHRSGCPIDEVDDAVQDTWLSFLFYSERIEVHGALGAWLWITATNHGRKAARRATRSRERAEQTATDRTRPAESDSLDEVEHDAHVRASLPALRHAIGRLHERDRALLACLYAADGKQDYGSISAQLGMPVGAIGPTRGRILRKLRGDQQLCHAYLVA